MFCDFSFKPTFEKMEPVISVIHLRASQIIISALNIKNPLKCKNHLSWVIVLISETAFSTSIVIYDNSVH